MDLKKFNRCEMAMGAIVGAAVGWSVASGNFILPVVAVIVGMTFEHLCRRRVTEVIEDERILRISERASRRTFQVFMTTIAIIGVVLTALGKAGYIQFTQVGYTLAFSACAMLILYLIFYGYYSKRGLD